jgi:hypothetical protein
MVNRIVDSAQRMYALAVDFCEARGVPISAIRVSSKVPARVANGVTPYYRVMYWDGAHWLRWREVGEMQHPEAYARVEFESLDAAAEYGLEGLHTLIGAEPGSEIVEAKEGKLAKLVRGFFEAEKEG